MKANDAIFAKRIMNSILSYMMDRGVEDITVRLKVNDERIIAVAEGEVDKKPADLEELNQLINQKKIKTLEEYYSSLLGYSDNVNDIDLLGSMLDEGSISYDGDILTFYAMRISDNL